MKFIKKLRPIFIENSKVPVYLSKIAPIEIGAISIGIFVWSRHYMSDTTKNHETIHFQQQLELLFVFHWLLYGIFYLKNYYLYRDGATAYRESPFEREAYENEFNLTFLETRERYNWRHYIY